MHKSGEIINQRYYVENVLGKGGVGITYSAIDNQTDSLVAIKAVSLKKLNDWKQVELFEREAQVLAKLDHPNIPKYLDYFSIETEKDKVFYIVQQLAPGKSLFELVQGSWRTTEAEVKQIATQILAILDYLHSLKPPVIHRDIKPHNLILDESGKVYLVDFGAVQNTYYDTLMQGSTVVGTYGYMAPEQFRGKAFPVTDLYGLGATLLFLLTHRSPAELPQNALKLDFRSQVNVSEVFVEWLEKIFEPDPEDRFSSAKQALDKLQKKHSHSSSRNVIRKLAALSVFAITGIGILGLNSNKQDILMRTQFYQKKLCSNSKIARKYINQGNNINTILTIDNRKKSFVSCLIGAEDSQLIKLIKENQNNIKDRKSYNEIMLLHAIRVNNKKDLLLFINKEIDINIEFPAKKTRYVYSCYQSNFLYEAILKYNSEIVGILIDKGININHKCKINPPKGSSDSLVTPFSTAIDLRSPTIVKLLIEKGAIIDYDLFPITIANRISAEKDPQSISVLKLLLENGLDPSKEKRFGKLESLRVIDPNYIQSPAPNEKVIYYDSLKDFAKKRRKSKMLAIFAEFTVDKND